MRKEIKTDIEEKSVYRNYHEEELKRLVGKVVRTKHDDTPCLVVGYEKDEEGAKVIVQQGANAYPYEHKDLKRLFDTRSKVKLPCGAEVEV